MGLGPGAMIVQRNTEKHIPKSKERYPNGIIIFILNIPRVLDSIGVLRSTMGDIRSALIAFKIDRR